MTAERELALLCCGTRARRRATEARVASLAGRADFAELTCLLSRQGLLPLVGSRLAEATGRDLPDGFREDVERVTRQFRRRALLYEEMQARVVAALERREIQTLPLKGVSLARRAHGDVGLRACRDIDVLVPAERLDDGVAALVHAGWARPRDPVWRAGRPILHYTLEPQSPALPPVELHWRIHWNETAFSRELLDAAAVEGQPTPEELAALLLFFARDSFAGLRLGADVSAWWDRHGAALAPAALDPILGRHPRLRAPLLAALDVGERLFGVPAGALAGNDRAIGRRVSRAARLANWSQDSRGELDRSANVALVDWLLSPGETVGFVRRYFVHPLDLVALTYSIPERARLRQALRGGVHAAGAALRLGPRFIRAMWRVRGQRTWSPRPDAHREAVSA